MFDRRLRIRKASNGAVCFGVKFSAMPSVKLIKADNLNTIMFDVSLMNTPDQALMQVDVLGLMDAFNEQCP